MTPGEWIVDRLEAGYQKFLNSLSRSPSNYPTNRASSLGHPCLRYLVLCRTRGIEARRIPDTTMALFREGDIHERDIMHVLEDELHLSVRGTQQSFPPNDYQITGHVDARLYAGRAGDEQRWVGLECKSVNPNHWSRIKEASDMIGPTMPRWVHQWYSQSQIYMYLSDVEEWVYILKNKITGRWKVLLSTIDYEHVEKCLDRAEKVNAHVEADTLPDQIRDPSICRLCKFFETACTPAMDLGPGMLVLTEPEIVELAEQVLDNQQPAFVHGWARKRLSDILKMAAGKKSRPVVAGRAKIDVTVSKTGQMRMTVRPLIGEEEIDTDGEA